MASPRLELVISVETAHPVIAGNVVAHSGGATAFQGWTELIGLIDRATSALDPAPAVDQRPVG